MKSTLKIISLSLLTLIAYSSLDQARAIEADKARHLGVSAAATSTCAIVGRAVSDSKWMTVGCFLAVNAVGAAKEMTDPLHGGQTDRNDMYFNLAGSGASMFVFTTTF